MSDGSKNFVTRKVPQMAAASETDSFSSPSPISRFPPMAATVSGRTRSKVKILDPTTAQISVKTYPFDSSPFTPTPVSSDSPESEEEIHSLGHLSPTAVPFNDQSENSENQDEATPVKVLNATTPQLSCANTRTSMTAQKLENLLEACNPGCSLVVPQPEERCHDFSNFEPDQAIPCAVFSAQFFRLGLSLPLHPFIVDILNTYKLAPLQLTPNSYRMAICMYILYDSLFQVKLTARELGFFYQLKETGKTSGFYYLTTWNIHIGKCIKGNKQGMSGWHKQFLYCYDCPSYRTDFNHDPPMPLQTDLEDEELKRARKALKKSAGLGDGARLLTKRKLIRLGFSKKLSTKSLEVAGTLVEKNLADETLNETGFPCAPASQSNLPFTVFFLLQMFHTFVCI